MLLEITHRGVAKVPEFRHSRGKDRRSCKGGLSGARGRRGLRRGPALGDQGWPSVTAQLEEKQGLLLAAKVGGGGSIQGSTPF